MRIVCRPDPVLYRRPGLSAPVSADGPDLRNAELYIRRVVAVTLLSPAAFYDIGQSKERCLQCSPFRNMHLFVGSCIYPYEYMDPGSGFVCLYGLFHVPYAETRIQICAKDMESEGIIIPY